MRAATAAVQFLEKFDTVHFRHLVIEGDEPDGLVRFDEIERIYVIRGGQNLFRFRLFPKESFQFQFKSPVFVYNENATWIGA